MPKPLTSAAEHERSYPLAEVSNKILIELTAAATPKNFPNPYGGVELHEATIGYTLDIIGPTKDFVRSLYRDSDKSKVKGSFRLTDENHYRLQFSAMTLSDMVRGVNSMLPEDHQIVVQGLGNGIA